MPELNIAPNNPLLLHQFDIFDTPNSKLFIKDTEVIGLCDFAIDSFHIDLDKGYYDTNFLFKQIRVNGTYDLNARILVPIVSKGPVYLVTGISNNRFIKIRQHFNMCFNKKRFIIYISVIFLLKLLNNILQIM